MAAGAGSAPPPQIFEGLAFCVCEPTGQEGEENKVRTGKRPYVAGAAVSVAVRRVSADAQVPYQPCHLIDGKAAGIRLWRRK